MLQLRRLGLATLCAALVAAPAAAQPLFDQYTRYELLDGASGRYRVVRDLSVSPTPPRVLTIGVPGSVTDVSVVDRHTGAAVSHTAEAGRLTITGLRTVQPDGEVRLQVQYTAQNRAHFTLSGDEASFALESESRRNAVVLPAGFELLESNVPAQVIEEADGRLNVSSWNTMPVSVPLRLRLRKRPAAGAAAQAAVSSPAVLSPGTAATAASNALANVRVTERAIQDREIVYFLLQPESHSFRLYHDYTESRPGVSTYRNVVRGGSTVSDPSALLLDTGAPLKVETLKEKDAEVVVIHFPPVEAGKSSRLRITETYTDAGRYGLVNGQLVWNRNFGRPQNDVVLPAGWYLTDSAIPAVVTQESDGRIRLSFVNPRPDSIDVVIKARRR